MSAVTFDSRLGSEAADPDGELLDEVRARRARRRGSRVKPMRVLLHSFLVVMAIGWLIPIGTAIYNSFRDYQTDTQPNGPFAAPEMLTLDNYRAAWNVGEMSKTFGNTAFIVIPALFLTLLLAAIVAYVCTRYSWKFNIVFLVLFTAGNLMPQQVLFQPLFQFFKHMPWPDLISDTNTGNLLGTKIAVILIHVAFQIGFCTFVLSNFMKTIPKEISEAAAVDGAGVWRGFFQVILPLTRPALAALGTLEFTWLYNDFFWGSVLLNQGDERPITSSIAVLNGQYGSDFNLVAAASTLIALPTLIVYLVLQKQFISGLTLGASKG
ncbi:MAG: carbohydrate ABC transporter permease [Acidimicrobiaceae bacterium]|nr:carbohydrate ABC transporter permease [Acidimicrobiaceae bacterium]